MAVRIRTLTTRAPAIFSVAVLLMVLPGCSDISSDVGLGCQPNDLSDNRVLVSDETDATSGVEVATVPPEPTAIAEPIPTAQPTAIAEPIPTAQPDSDPTRQAQTLLNDLGYWTGRIDGRPGPTTAHAIVAFEKLNGLTATGVIEEDIITKLENASRPTAVEPDRPGLEIDLSHQVARLVVDGTVRWVFDISSGSPATPTPPGDFTIFREVDGPDVAPLGTLYRPKYFNNGIALHGYPSVPPEPASHGCIRFTNSAMDLLWSEGHLPIGARVTVYS